jgi:hypothetical protein
MPGISEKKIEKLIIMGTVLLCGRARSYNQMGENPIPEGWPATG